MATKVIGCEANVVRVEKTTDNFATDKNTES